jgi:ribonucleoside-triphosphate reductase
MGEKISDALVCKNFVRKVIENYQLPYITVTPTFSICPKHGYINGEHDFCPHCDKEIGFTGEKFDINMRLPYTADDQKRKDLETILI